MTLPCTLQKLTQQVYWFTPDSTTDRPSLGAIFGANGTLMVEAGASAAHVKMFLDALVAESISAPRYVVLTHWHWDHIFGAAALGGIPMFAHQETARQIKIQAGYDWSDKALDQRVQEGLEIAFCRDMIKAELPDRSELRILLPDIVFTDSLTVDLGDRSCEMLHVGGDHSSDSCVIYSAEDRVVFLGDCHYPNIHHAEHYYTERIFSLLERLLGYDAEYYIEGHGDKVISGDDLQQFERDLKAAYEAVKHHEANRDAALRKLQPQYSDLAEIDWAVDAFIAGLAVKQVKIS